MRVLIPETLARNVLAAVRSLGRAGHEVSVAAPTRAGKEPSVPRSRYVKDVTHVTSPLDSPSVFIEDLKRMVTGGDYDVLLPFTHSSVVPISYNLDALLEMIHIPIVEYPVLLRAHDKLDTVKLARELGVPTPVTFHPNSMEELVTMEEQVPFPCLIKARQGCGVGTTIRFAKSFDELLSGYKEIHGQGSNLPVSDYTLPIIQEYVPGQIHDAVFLYARGESRGALTQERVITYPVQGGPGVVNTTTDDPLLLDLGQRLLDALGWHGPAQVEFRHDPRDGKYKLLEINPKFWGTLPLSMVAGIDFALMACELADQGDVEPCFDYRVGVTFRWLFPNELRTVAQEPSWKRIGQFLRFGTPDTYYDFDAGDPWPDVSRTVKALYAVLLKRHNLLPVRRDLNEMALARPPAQQSRAAVQRAEGGR